jgi:hypothetical protein
MRHSRTLLPTDRCEANETADIEKFSIQIRLKFYISKTKYLEKID